MAKNNTIRLYDLALASGVTLSPFVWRTKLALLLKGFEIDDVPTTYTGIRRMLDGTYRRLPVIDDNGTIVPDSLFIADYLDEKYPERPPLFRTKSERNFLRWLDAWMFSTVVRPWFSCYSYDQVLLVAPEDKDYVLTAHTRIWQGKHPKDQCADREERLPTYRPLLDPIRNHLKETKWFGGDEPNQVDCMMLGHFLWCASLASAPPLAKDDPLFDYINRGFDRFASVARDPRLYTLA
ncbi:MAG TPA: glutathione S-transferase N-terminal domain-containing protein [Alphaproteobacteria bacterium]|nr:glutathione S-transferase N-terminal domain-containing protein [Alphaproteobacteria bacterium]